ncbi:(ZYRO0D05434g) [Zygosaccharomyces parabailii]|uniref:ZYBA0S07-04170g1_1 n=1 Tax=Zygosaccharomyces bailii (strain CLIB 213 / ATCC 58445 / CBS 680 / BCRC 21525 / NBRC 1098 / NCYC 1416 / NRRL Y-2227) TaxID=1333698 RepID=A0A8J2XC71_ZYGB2|nr:(ZYRO0D05434g) [Zygosaccharomyces parabailii]CDF90572.1 ZYBA0S07-04170g1_1 [Zygosaccharomyces bailii CLIB 213]CDH15058.1 uncharacterized protein ZBAI_06844 [Zygosaccharomyces bailii ISA1307]
MQGDDMTESKLGILCDLYSDIVPRSQESESFYLEILVACHGSLNAAVEMINESLGVCRFPNGLQLRKRKYDGSEESKGVRKIQRSLNYFITDSNNRIRAVSDNSGGKISSNPIELFTKEDIEANVKYITFHRNALPEPLADSLLQHLVQDEDNFTPNQFHLFGKKCTSNHLTKMFSSNEDILLGRSKIYYNSYTRTNVAKYDDDLKMAQLLIEDQVNETIAKQDPQPFQIRCPDWRGDVVLVNRYDRDSNLDWHSDRMTSIGPQPIIASLSLGCVREFRVRRTYPANSQVYVLRPPHNTLMIMHAGFQEEYKHCVHAGPKNATLEQHPISKDIRINLTYRCYLQTYLRNCPTCTKCGSSMDLRRAFKDPKTRGQYLWQCSRGYKGEDCDGVKRADFQNECLTVRNYKEQGSRWLAPDDNEARNAQKVGT